MYHWLSSSLSNYVDIYFTGVITSPNYPRDYPNNLQKTETIRTKKGMVIEIEFTTFKLYSSSDWLTIRDGNESILMDTKNGNGNALPPKIWSFTNVVQFEFVTNSYDTSTGWRATWTAVTPAGSTEDDTFLI